MSTEALMRRLRRTYTLPIPREPIRNTLLAYCDMRDLIAEVDRLTAENQRLRAHLSAYSDGRPVLRQPEGPTP